MTPHAARLIAPIIVSSSEAKEIDARAVAVAATMDGRSREPPLHSAALFPPLHPRDSSDE